MRTLPLSWNDSLFKKLKQLNRHNSGSARIAILGIGNDLRGDDSAGLIVARRLLTDERLTQGTNLIVLEGGPAPENQTGKLRAFRPDLVLFIDAAHWDESPGTVQLIPIESIDGMSASSHSLPLSMLARYIISEFGCQVEMIGIQPAQNEISEELSIPVRDAVDEMVRQLGNLLA
jgi:hydrogenase maturation protease HycI